MLKPWAMPCSLTPRAPWFSAMSRRWMAPAAPGSTWASAATKAANSGWSRATSQPQRLNVFRAEASLALEAPAPAWILAMNKFTITALAMPASAMAFLASSRVPARALKATPARLPYSQIS